VALRESGQAAHEQYALGAVTREAGGESGVAHGAYLARLAEVVVRRDHPGVRALRAEGVERLGASGVARAIGVAAGFDGINRVADAIGIPLDDRFGALEASFWEETGLGRWRASSGAW
jgi:hypothetical protein